MPLEIESYKAKFSIKQRKLVIEATPLRLKFDKDIEIKENEVNFDELSKEKQEKKQKNTIQISFENEMLDELVWSY